MEISAIVFLAKQRVRISRVKRALCLLFSLDDRLALSLVTLNKGRVR